MIPYDYPKHQTNVGILFLVDDTYVTHFVGNAPMKRFKLEEIKKLIIDEIKRYKFKTPYQRI